MRYSILLGWLLLLLAPFIASATGHGPSLRPTDAIGQPSRYLQAFAEPYRRLLPARWQAPAPLQAVLPDTAPRDAVVKTWTDEKGVVHFADPAASPTTAREQRVQVAPNGALITPPSVVQATARSSDRGNLLVFITALLLTALAIGLLHRAGSWLYNAVQELLLDWRTPPQAEPPKPAPLPAFDFHGSDNRDPYAVLGLSPNAPDKNLRAVHEKLQAQYSPDHLLGLDPGAQEAARLKAAALEAAWQQICRERGL